MGILDRIASTLTGDDRTPDVEYQCTNCGERFETARGECPECGSIEIRELSSSRFRPEGSGS